MKKLPLSIQIFPKLINNDCLYVDKTKIIYDLLSGNGEYFFLSRPRRFGKSLLVSTLAEIFRGNKELFKGLWIYDRIEWTAHPVIHIDLSTIDFKTPEILEESLKAFLKETAITYGVILDDKRTYKDNFVELIKKLSSLNQVVILIDEYDKPLLEYIETEEIEMSKNIRRVLKNFYGILKGMGAYIRFVFITGVSKFSRVSVFSDLNNLIDITLNEKFSMLLGYTEEELRYYFSSHIERMAQKEGMAPEELLKIIREWYNGYSWDGKNFVYNPFSILSLFNTDSFDNYWFSTGTPTFLIKRIREGRDELMEFENMSMEGITFDSFDIENPDIACLLFQAGYLTIKKITKQNVVKSYELSYPNREVRESFLTNLFGEYSVKGVGEGNKILKQMIKAISSENVEGFIQEIKSLLASIPYQIFIKEKEAYYHSLVYLAFRLSGAEIHCEDCTNTGRIDAVWETGKTVYILEFKVGTAEEALKQIKAMNYFEKYVGKEKKIVLLGIGFDPEKRNIGDYLVESL